MAKILLKNTREHDITLHLVSSDQVSSVTIPSAQRDPADDKKLIPGTAEADSDMVAAAKKKHAPVRHYFNEGWLVEGDSKADDKKSDDKK